MDYKVTKADHFLCLRLPVGCDEIIVEYSDLPSGWHWRLKVNDETGPWTTGDLLYLDRYMVVSEYFSQSPDPWTPFQICRAMKHKSEDIA